MLFTATAYIAINLLVDIAYAALNPRIGVGGGRDGDGRRASFAGRFKVQNRALKRLLSQAPGAFRGAGGLFLRRCRGVRALLGTLRPRRDRLSGGAASRRANAILLGTDDVGRDVLSRVIYGARASASSRA